MKYFISQLLSFIVQKFLNYFRKTFFPGKLFNVIWNSATSISSIILICFIFIWRSKQRVNIYLPIFFSCLFAYSTPYKNDNDLCLYYITSNKKIYSVSPKKRIIIINFQDTMDQLHCFHNVSGNCNFWSRNNCPVIIRCCQSCSLEKCFVKHE